MKNFLKNKFATILVLIATVVLAGIAIFTAYRLYTLRQEAVTPNVPSSKPKADCTPKCPDTDGVLRDCELGYDGTYEHWCGRAGRIELCGGREWCCPSVNGAWTTDLTICQTSSSPTATPDSSCQTLSFTTSTTPTATATSTPTATATVTPTTTATSNPTAAPTGTSTQAQASLPEAGTSLPSILGLGAGTILLLVSLLLAL